MHPIKLQENVSGKMLLFSTILFILFPACGKQTTSPLQKTQKFAEVYAELLVAIEIEADSTAPVFTNRAARLPYADSVLRSLGYSRQEFESAIQYYRGRPERWQKVYTHVVKILEARNQSADTTRTKNSEPKL
jgi:hypothetical protein